MPPLLIDSDCSLLRHGELTAGFVQTGEPFRRLVMRDLKVG